MLTDSKIQALIADRTHHAVIITDRDQNIVWVNKNFEAMSGYTLAEVKGRNPRFLQGDGNDIEARQRITEGIAGGGRFSQSILNYHASGVPYWVELDISPILDDDGQVEYYLSIQTDITSKMLADKELRSSEFKLRSIFNSTDEAHLLIAPGSYQVLAFNDSARRYVGSIQKLELEMGRSVLDYILSDFLDSFTRDFEKAVKGETVETEICIGSGGRDYWFFIRYKPVYDNLGNLVGVSYNATDISRRKQAEISLLNKNRKLEEYAFVTSHNLRAPITNILALVDLLKEFEMGFDPNDLNLTMRQLKEASGHLDAAVHQLNKLVSDNQVITFSDEKVVDEPQKVMLVDDDPMFISVSERLINRKFPELTIEAHNKPMQALGHLNESKPDIVFLDINMGEYTGWDFLENLASSSHQPVVYMLTSSINPADKRRAKEYKQVRGFLSKPLNRNVLEQVLSQAS